MADFTHAIVCLPSNLMPSVTFALRFVVVVVVCFMQISALASFAGLQIWKIYEI